MGDTLPSYTDLLKLPGRRLYAIHDWELPVPIDLFQAAVFVVVGVLNFLLLRRFGVRFTAGTGWVFVVIPGLAARLARMPVGDGKHAHRWLLAQVRYLLEPRVLHRLEARKEPDELRVRATVWQPRAMAGRGMAEGERNG